MNQTNPINRIRLLPFCRAWVAVALVAIMTHGASQTAFAEKCLNEANGGAPNCTSEDIKVASIEVLEPVIEPCTGPGDTFTFNGILHVVSTASQRYDVGFYIGPNARTSTTDNCTVTILPSNSGGPTNDGDFCGDVNTAGTFNVPVFNVTAACQDTDNNGFFDVSSCSTWRQSASNADCPDEAHALPGTTAKCKCTPVNTTLEIPQCTTNAECTDNLVCTGAVCDPSSTNADGFGCTFPNLPTTTICRGSTGVCDPAERCTGTSGTCPSDTISSTATVCRASTGVCDPAENCTGTSGSCPANAITSSTTVCRASTGVCDPAENCTGTSGGCPTNSFTPSTTECRGSSGVCDPAENCTGTSGSCPADTVRPSTTVCRTSSGVCDPAENCDGATGACPADTVLPSTTVCRASTGVCDPAENCDGETGTCPTDSTGAGAVCRASTGVCDPEEVCSDASGSCPEDTISPSTTECRGSSGVCDPPENCDGASGTCPADTFTPSSTECRGSSGVCDSPENCDGETGACPTDTFTPSSTECRGSTGVCDPPENCDGATGACPTDTLSPSTTVCRGSSGVCDPAENCTGASGVCPADDPAAGDGTPCDDGLFCTTDDECSNGTCEGTPRVCDDGKECSEDSCNEAELKCDFTECEPVIDGEICRTAGYWGTHGGYEAKRNATAVNVTQALLDAVGPLDVCGESISETSNLSKPYLDGLGLTSALEGLCVRVQTVQQRQLYRSLVAAALNCAASGAANACELIVPEFTDCDLVCQGTPPQGAPTLTECVVLLDCFNNGGELVAGDCAFGTCESEPLINCGFDFPACPAFGGLPQPCVPFEDNCHDAELCNEDLGFCPGDTPASSDAACREANSNNCTIDSCP